MNIVTQKKSPSLKLYGRGQCWAATHKASLKLTKNINVVQVRTKKSAAKFIRTGRFTRQRFSNRSFAASEVEHPLLTWPDLIHKLWSVQLAPVHAQVQHHRTIQFAIHQDRFPQVAQLRRSSLSHRPKTPTSTIQPGSTLVRLGDWILSIARL